MYPALLAVLDHAAMRPSRAGVDSDKTPISRCNGMRMLMTAIVSIRKTGIVCHEKKERSVCVLNKGAA